MHTVAGEEEEREAEERESKRRESRHGSNNVGAGGGVIVEWRYTATGLALAGVIWRSYRW